MLLIPYVLITSGGYSPVKAGLAMLPLPILMTSVSPTMGSLAARIGPRIPLTVGPLIVGAGMVISQFMAPDASYWL
ncbi:MAG: MFS transporter, partial [Bradyrhizobium sp.]|nr:MFS transporter [Bradyrhizobium sp.]